MSGLISQTDSIIIKGTAILFVICSHLGNQFTRLTTPLGGIGVCIFLVISGYGLEKSYISEVQSIGGGGEMNNWWKKRIISVYIPYWITCIFLLPTKSYFAPFELDKLQDLILDLTLVKPYFGLGWYLSYLVLQYILFWGLHKVIKNTKTRLAILALISVLFAMYFNRMSYIRFEQAFSFTAGVLIADYESVMEKYFFRKEVIFVLLISGIFLLGIKQVNFVREMSQTVLNILNLFIKEFIGMGLVVAVIVFKKYNISNWLISILNSVITLLGRISYELYLAHGYALMVFKLNLSKFVGVIVFIECTIAGTLFLYYINKKISVLLKKRIFK